MTFLRTGVVFSVSKLYSLRKLFPAPNLCISQLGDLHVDLHVNLVVSFFLHHVIASKYTTFNGS